MLFYVRRHTCADGSFEWYVLNGNTGGARAKPFRREQRRQRSARSCRRGSTWPRQKCLGERRKADRGNPRRRRVLYGIGFPTINRLALPGHAAFCRASPDAPGRRDRSWLARRDACA